MERGVGSGGHSPRALEATALAFTTGYLGFTNVTVVLSHSITRPILALIAAGAAATSPLPA